MQEKAILQKELDVSTFRNYYYLKTELMDFCRENGLSPSGSKLELTERIALFLESGSVLPNTKTSRHSIRIDHIDEHTKIEANFVCSERHRAFFKDKIGMHFSFPVSFQTWLKNNPGKTYADAIVAYKQLLKEKKRGCTTIDKQFEYNTYIRAFFADNKGLKLKDAIACWNYKKSLPGHHRYEKTDLIVLK